MPRVHHRKARKNYEAEGIKKGDMYFTWAIKTGPASGRVYRSLTKPRPSQLTASDFFSTLYAAQESFHDSIAEAGDPSDLESAVESYKSELESLKDDTQGKFDNMPEGLQQGDTGTLLSERVDNVDSLINDLDGVNIPSDEEIKEECPVERVEEPAEGEDDFDEEGYERKLQEVKDELYAIEYQGE